MLFPILNNIILSESAERDLDDIASYTIQRFGSDQLYAYFSAMAEMLEVLYQHPDYVKKHAHLTTKMRIYHFCKHLIVYYPTQTMLYVSRILHEKVELYYQKLDT